MATQIDWRYYAAAKNIFKTIVRLHEEEDLDSKYYVFTRNGLKDYVFMCPTVQSSYISPNALIHYKESTSSNKITDDHRYSRTQTVRLYDEYIRDGLFHENNLDVQARWLRYRCIVNKVTTKENTALSAIQNTVETRDLSWQEQAKLVGIMHWCDKPSPYKYIYEIDGVVYKSLKEIKRVHQVNLGTIIARCRAKRKWSTWLQIPNR
jgi:hypothetical protein